MFSQWIFRLSGAFALFASTIGTAEADRINFPQISMSTDLTARFVPAPFEENPDNLYAANESEILLACPQLNEVAIARHYESSPPFLNLYSDRIQLDGEIPDRFTISGEWWNAVSAVIDSSQLSEDFMVSVDSSGGDVMVSRLMIQQMSESTAHITTFGIEESSSMASLILFTGDQRIVTRATVIGLHETSVSSDGSTQGRMWHDDSRLSEERSQRISAFNEWFRSEYLNASRTNISEHCVNHLIGQQDIIVSPYDALRLGWVERVYISGDIFYERADYVRSQSYKRVVPPSSGAAIEWPTIAPHN